MILMIVGPSSSKQSSILSLKNLRNELASDCVSGVSGDELDGLRWRIELKVFQSVRGLEDDSVTRFVRCPCTGQIKFQESIA